MPSDHYHIGKVPVCRFQNDQLLIYETFVTGLPRSDAQRDNEKNLTRGEYNGYMSPKTKSKVKKYLETWIDAGMLIRNSSLRHQLDKVPYFTFVTLTLPAMQMHSDNEIKRKCLTPFIQTLQRKFDVWHYFWRAEPQQNGNIHFHLIIDSYIKHNLLRMEWNQCINKLGYVDRFEAKFQHNNPNSTDIHSFRSIRHPAAYVIKYCLKTDGYRKIEGRIHGCSDGLRTLQPYEDIMCSRTQDFVLDVMNDEKSAVIDRDEFTIVKCSVAKMIEKYYPDLRKSIAKHKISQAFELYRQELPEEIQGFIQKRERKRLIQLELFS
jgi:hypothetical protein